MIGVRTGGTLPGGGQPQPVVIHVAEALSTSGDLVVTEGTFDFLGKEFELDAGIVRLDPDEPDNPFVNVTAHWEGPDGGRVLTFYNKAGGYGSSLLPPEGWPFPVWLALMQTNDNLGPQGPEVVDEILERVEKEAPGTEVVTGTLDDFYNALAACPMEDVPVVRADIADSSELPGAPFFRMVSAPSRSSPLRSIQAIASASDATCTPHKKLLINFIFDPLPTGPR